MKSKKVYQLGVFLILIIIAIGSFLLLNPKNLTPQETVDHYFTYFNNQDEKRMWSLVTDSLRGATAVLDYLESVYLMSCYEEMNDENIDVSAVRENGFLEFEYVAKVYVEFDIRFIDNAPSMGGFNSGVNRREFYLAKKAENDPWIIVAIV